MNVREGEREKGGLWGDGSFFENLKYYQNIRSSMIQRFMMINSLIILYAL